MKDMYEPLELHEVKEQVAKHASFPWETADSTNDAAL